MGTLTAGMEWFKPWRTISGEDLADPLTLELQVLLEGACDPDRFLALVRDFIVFEDDGGPLVKKMAGIPPVSRRPRRAGRDVARRQVAAGARCPGTARTLRVRTQTGWRPRRPGELA